MGPCGSRKNGGVPSGRPWDSPRHENDNYIERDR